MPWFSPSRKSIIYATGAFPGVATYWRRAGAAFVVVPADEAAPLAAIVGDLQAKAFAAQSGIADVRSHRHLGRDRRTTPKRSRRAPRAARVPHNTISRRRSDCCATCSPSAALLNADRSRARLHAGGGLSRLSRRCPSRGRTARASSSGCARSKRRTRSSICATPRSMPAPGSFISLDSIDAGHGRRADDRDLARRRPCRSRAPRRSAAAVGLGLHRGRRRRFCAGRSASRRRPHQDRRRLRRLRLQLRWRANRRARHAASRRRAHLRCAAPRLRCGLCDAEARHAAGRHLRGDRDADVGPGLRDLRAAAISDTASAPRSGARSGRSSPPTPTRCSSPAW